MAVAIVQAPPPTHETTPAFERGLFVLVSMELCSQAGPSVRFEYGYLRVVENQVLEDFGRTFT